MKKSSLLALLAAASMGIGLLIATGIERNIMQAIPALVFTGVGSALFVYLDRRAGSVSRTHGSTELRTKKAA